MQSNCLSSKRLKTRQKIPLSLRTSLGNLLVGLSSQQDSMYEAERTQQPLKLSEKLESIGSCHIFRPQDIPSGKRLIPRLAAHIPRGGEVLLEGVADVGEVKVD